MAKEKQAEEVVDQNPVVGGSYLRQPDGTLVQNHEDDAMRERQKQIQSEGE